MRSAFTHYLRLHMLLCVIAQRVVAINVCAVVIDFEAFIDVNNVFIIKEFTIVDVVHGLSRVVLFKSAYDRTNLDRKYTRVAEWLEQNRHGMAWSGGYVDYTIFEATVRDACASCPTVCTKGKGEDMLRFLSVYQSNVKDLSNIHGPKYDRWTDLQI